MNKVKITSKALNNLRNDSKLKDYVIDYINEYYTTSSCKLNFINDLLEHGCVSGMVGELIYYSDTTKFYTEYKEEIWEMIINLSDDQGCTPFELINSLNADINCVTQFENLLAWFGFEETVRGIANELGIEI